MKTFKQFREECGCKDKERKVKSKKKSNVEVMPNIPDGKKGMTTNVNNESVFAGNYQGPLYARHPDLVIAEKAVSKKQQNLWVWLERLKKVRGRHRLRLPKLLPA